MATASVVVKVTAINVHVLIGDREVPLANDGNTWSGSLNDVLSCADAVKTLRIIAPAFTDWSIVVKCDGVKVLEDEGTTNKDPFVKRWPTVNAKPAQP
ncbi:MAG: hypothetical protein ABJE47_22160 [bacterium]